MIVLLVVVAIVFVVTLALGGSHGPRQPDDPSGIGFLDGIQGNRFLHLGDKAETTCVTGDQTTLSVPAAPNACAITVGKRSFFSRPTRVVFNTGGSIVVTVDSKNVPGRATSVDGGKCFGSAVDHGGGTITLTAPFATTVTLLTVACPRDDAGS